MSYRREHRASRASLFDDYDGLEEGGLKASSSHSHDISEHENDKALDNLKERAIFLKRRNTKMEKKIEAVEKGQQDSTERLTPVEGRLLGVEQVLQELTELLSKQLKNANQGGSGRVAGNSSGVSSMQKTGDPSQVEPDSVAKPLPRFVDASGGGDNELFKRDHYHYHRLEMPLFTGEYPIGWVFRAE